MSQFDIILPETIKSGDATDVYFDRTVETIEHADRNPAVVAEISADQFPTGAFELLAGVKDAAYLLEGLRSTTYSLLAGILTAGLLQAGAAHGGAFLDGGGGDTQAAREGSMGDRVESYFFWLVGLMAPAFIGLKAAMAAGVSPRQITGAGSPTRRSPNTDASGEGDVNRTALIHQTKHSPSKVDGRLGNYGNTVVSSASSMAGEVKGKAPEVPNTIAKNVQVGKTTTKRAAKDSYSAARHAAGSLGESPVDWARAGIDHYRREPLGETHREISDTGSAQSAATNDDSTVERTPPQQPLDSQGDDEA